MRWTIDTPALGATIAALTLCTGPLVAQVSIPDTPAQDLTGTLVVLNKSGHDASFIDLATGETVAVLPTGEGPHELLVTKDGRTAVGTDYNAGNSLTVFDVTEPRVVRTIDLSDYPRPHGIVWLPGEREVLVTSEASNTLVVVDIAEGRVVRAIDTEQPGSHMVAVSEDGSVAYTSNGQGNSVSVIDVAAGEVTRILDVPAQPEAITTTRAGDEIWVGSNRDVVVSVVSPEDGTILRQWDGFNWPYRILLTRDERYAVMPDMRTNTIRFFDNATSEELGSIDLPLMGPQGVVLHPDDRTLFLSLSRRDRVIAIDIESREILGSYRTGSSPDGIGVSPVVIH
jgi:DNA-binding beta-propeller fold protein YncE